MEEPNYENYTLRDGIKIRRLIDIAIRNHPNKTLEECLDSIKLKMMNHQYCLLVLLFKYNYKDNYHLYKNYIECYHVIQNQYSGKFYSKKKFLRKSAKFNESDFFLYLGTYSNTEFKYHLFFDFIIGQPAIADYKEFDLSSYVQIDVPDRIIDIPKDTGYTYSSDAFDLIISNKLSDFPLPCKDGVLPISRIILAMNSPYFKSYFLFNENNAKQDKLEYSMEDIKIYLYYCIHHKVDREKLHAELISMGKYFMDDLFVKYVHQEMIIKIDESSDLSSGEKLELYKNLLTYL